MKTIALYAAVGSFALAQPALAQDHGDQAERAAADIHKELDRLQADEMEDDLGLAMAEMMGAIFSAEPLTTEQEARLPAASEAAQALVPQGIYARMMRELMDTTLGGIFDMAVGESDAMSNLELADYTGLSSEEIDALSDEQRRELTTIFDPVYQERIASKMTELTANMERIYDQFEPGLREGLSRAMATRFSDAELDAINAFFATPVGAKYAGESLIMFSDPQVMASVGQAMPALMEEMPAMFGGQSNVSDGLPEPRRYDDLTPSEQRRASEILGVEQTTLRESMTEAETMEAAGAVGDAAEDVAEVLEESEEETESFEEAMEGVGAQ